MQTRSFQKLFILHQFFILLFFVRIVITQTVVCPSGTNYFQGKCFSDCNVSTIIAQSDNTLGFNISTLYYVSQGIASCTQSCSFQCATCDTYSDNCLSCPQINSSNFLLLSKCYKECPQLYFQNYTTLTCDLCNNQNIGCANCSLNIKCSEFGGSYNCSWNQTKICLTCDTGNVMYYQTATNFSLCLAHAPDGQVNILGIAVKCNNQCLTCSIFTWNCTYCSSLIYYNSQCIPSCPISHFNITINISFNSNSVQTQICTLCISPCSTCLSQHQCLSCVTGFYYSPITFQCVTANSCPLTTYPNNTNYQCEQCPNPCRRCLNYYQCQQCLSGYLYQTGCRSQCPSRTYQTYIFDILSLENVTLVCSACIQPCKQCLNDTACINCIDSSIIYFFSFNLSCLYACPTQYFQKKQTMTCQKCPQYCQTCNQTLCFSCIQINNTDAYYLQQGQCLIQCMPSFYPNTGVSLICQSCPNECLTCLNITFCTKCIPDYFFVFYDNYSSVCQTSCPAPYFVEDKDSFDKLVCKKCSDYLCQLCTKQDYCQSCLISYNSTGVLYDSIALFNGKCYLDCVQPYQKVLSSFTSRWTCQIPITYVNTTQIQVIKGVIVKQFFPFLGSYASAGLVVFVLVVFIIIRCNQNEKGLFFVILSACISLPESYVIILTGYTHFMYHLYQFIDRFQYNALSLILFGCFLCYLIINIVNIYLFAKVSSQDRSYQEWKKHNSIFSSFVLIVTNSISLLNYKFHNILWSKFGSLPVLEQVSKLNYYNAICGIGSFPTLGILICSGFSYVSQQQIKNIYLDAIIVIAFQTILLFISLKRPKDLFVFHLRQISDDLLSNSKRSLHRRIVQRDQIIANAIKPSGIQLDYEYLNKKIGQNLDSQILTSNWDKYITECQKSSSNSGSERMIFQVSSNRNNKNNSKGKSQIIFDYKNEDSQQIIFNRNNSLNQSLISFQSSNQLISMNDNEYLLVNQSKNIHKSNANPKNQKKIRQIISKSDFIQRNHINFSEDQKSQTADQLNDALSQIEQATDRGEQGSMQQSQQSQIQQVQLNQQQVIKTKMTTEFNKQNQKALLQSQTFVHNQKQNQFCQIQKQSFQNIKILDLLNSEEQNDDISDIAVFQQSITNLSLKNQSNVQVAIEDSLTIKNLSSQVVKQQHLQQKQKDMTQNQQKQLDSDQESFNQQYYGGYSIDNSMGSIRLRDSQNQPQQTQNSNLTIICTEQKSQSSNIIGIKPKQNTNKINKSKIIQSQKPIELQDIYESIKVQKAITDKNNIKEFQKQGKRQLEQKNEKQQQNNVKSSLNESNYSNSMIDLKGWQQKNEVKMHQKTIQISEDIINDQKQLSKQQFDILPLVFNEGNQDYSQTSIIYKETQNQQLNQQKSVIYHYNDFTAKQRKIITFEQKKEEQQSQFKQNQNCIDNKQKEVKDHPIVLIKNQQSQYRDQEVIEFRIKTTLKSNKKKSDSNQKRKLKNEKKEEILVIQDKKFKKIKKQLKLLQKQKNKQKELISKIDGLNQNQIQKSKSLQKPTKSKEKRKIERQKDIQRIYSNAQLVTVHKKNQTKGQQMIYLDKTASHIKNDQQQE